MTDIRTQLEDTLSDVNPQPGGYEAVLDRVRFRARRRRIGAGVAAATIATVAAIAAVAVWSGGSSALANQIALPGKPIDSVAAGRTIWVLTCSSGCTGSGRNSRGHLVRIDTATRRVVSSTAVSDPQAVAVGDGSVWTIDFWSSTVTRTSPSGDVEATIALSLPSAIEGGDSAFLPFDIAVGQGAVWVSTGRGYVARIDPATNEVAAMIQVPADSTGPIVAGDGAVWVGESGGASLLRIDPSDNHVSQIPIVDSQDRILAVSGLALGDSLVYVSGTWAAPVVDAAGNPDYQLTNDQAVVEVDASSGAVLNAAKLSGQPSSLLTASGSLWVASSNSRTVAKVNPTKGTLVSPTNLPSGGTVVGIRRGFAWVTYPSGLLRAVPIRPHTS